MSGYKPGRRLYLTADGTTVVEADDPRRATLLVHAEGTIPTARARELGLIVDEDAAPADAKAVEEPKPNKAVAKAPANKAKE